jgi:hypothetical protein
MGAKYGFESITLPAFAKEFGLDESILAKQEPLSLTVPNETISETKSVAGKTSKPVDQRQLLEKANAINDILDKRILKKGGTLYDELENDVRVYLNEKLAAIFGNSGNKPSMTNEEIAFFKAMYKRVIEKEN